ncbi:MAG: acyl-CoA dehydrogenase family protein [Gammaproteobacteria bacterium]
MRVPLTEQARTWQERIRTFADEELRPWEVHAELHDGEIPTERKQAHRRRALELGLSRMDVPISRGGLELPVLAQVAVWEQLGGVTNALGWCFSEPHRWMFEVCSEEQIREYVMPLADGTRHECYAITEAESGSEVVIDTTAEPTLEGYRISGEKWYVTSANLADYFILQARIAGGVEDGEQALFFIDIDAPGVELVRTPPFSHTYAAHHPVYRFNAVQVPSSNRIGRPGDGMRYTHAWFRRERLMIAARCCGAAARLIEEATAFARDRRIGEGRLADQQSIQFMLADSTTELLAARLLTYETAAAHDRGEDLKVLHGRVAMAKLFASEMANRVADRAVQIFGGRGYMRENVAERYYRELRVDRIWEGTSEIQRLIIARGLLKRGLKGV